MKHINEKRKDAMNKNSLIIAVAIVAVGVAAIGAFIYVNQSNIALEREKIRTQQEQEQKAAERKATEEFSDTLRYNKCVQDAEDARMRDLAANSTHETQDANGNTIYHGNAATFDGIENRAQQAKQACALQS